MRRALVFVGVAVLFFALGWVLRGGRAEREERGPVREAVVNAPRPEGGHRSISLTVQRVAYSGGKIAEYEPVARSADGGFEIGPAEWVITIDGHMYHLRPR